MFDIQEALQDLPRKPGVYLFKDESETILYVGKAINLRNRVRQYFQSKDRLHPRTQKLVEKIRSFSYIVTDTEMEALILESNLIKAHEPHYNVLLKDDKTYPYIKVTVNEQYPRIFKTRKVLKDKAKYYGPFTNVPAVKETIELIHNIWKIRTCNKNLPKDIGKERTCLNYHIGRCLGPCNGFISQEEYHRIILEAMELLDGKQDEIIKKLKDEMNHAAANMDFEKAAECRDKINSIRGITEKQKMEQFGQNDQDIIGLASACDEALAQVFFIRNGKMTGNEHYFLNNTAHLSREEIMTAFIKQFYSGAAIIPKEIVTDTEIQDQEAISEWLASIRGSKVHLTHPQKGEKKRLLELASKNASLTFSQFGDRLKREKKRTIDAMDEIRQALNMSRKLKILEAYDISNIHGFESVGSMVVFEDGKPKKSGYRKFRIKTVKGADDYKSMEEVLQRRFSHAIEERKQLEAEDKDIQTGKFTALPDLILIDGGLGHVHAAEQVLLSLDIQIPVCGMVKDDKHNTRGLIFKEKELALDKRSEGFKLITRIQDEVHRFAITYHRSLRQKEAIHSVLDDIEGIGATRRKALLKHFGSVEGIRNADLPELSSVESMNARAAQSVYDFFRSEQLNL